MSLDEKQVAYLATQTLGRLATLDEHGNPQNNPVGFRYNPELGTIDIGGRDMAASRKFANLSQHPAVAFVVDDIKSRQPWVVRCLQIRGRAEAVRQGWSAGYGATDDYIRVQPDRVSGWGY